MNTIYKCEFCGIERELEHNMIEHEKECLENPRNMNLDYYIRKYENGRDYLCSGDAYGRGGIDVFNIVISDLKELRENFKI